MYPFPRSDFMHCFSDAMETDDKAGSSPAGKAADTVIMIIKSIAYEHLEIFCRTGFIL